MADSEWLGQVLKKLAAATYNKFETRRQGMSDSITPIQRSAAGATTFEKVETYEVKVPDNTASQSQTSPSKCSSSDDGVNFSKPMKTFLQQKKSYFVAPPAATDVQKDKRKQDQIQPDQVNGRALVPNQNPGSLFQVLG